MTGAGMRPVFHASSILRAQLLNRLVSEDRGRLGREGLHQFGLCHVILGLEGLLPPSFSVRSAITLDADSKSPMRLSREAIVSSSRSLSQSHRADLALGVEDALPRAPDAPAS